MVQAPARLIANNAGVEGDVIVEKVFGKSWETGYNAMDDRIEDLLEAGIIDPAKVCHIAVAHTSLVHPSKQHADIFACLPVHGCCARVLCAFTKACEQWPWSTTSSLRTFC